MIHSTHDLNSTLTFSTCEPKSSAEITIDNGKSYKVVEIGPQEIGESVSMPFVQAAPMTLEQANVIAAARDSVKKFTELCDYYDFSPIEGKVYNDKVTELGLARQQAEDKLIEAVKALEAAEAK